MDVSRKITLIISKSFLVGERLELCDLFFEFGDFLVFVVFGRCRCGVCLCRGDAGGHLVGERALSVFAESLVVHGHDGGAVSGCGHEFADGGSVLGEHGECRGAEVVESEVFASGCASRLDVGVAHGVRADRPVMVQRAGEYPCVRLVGHIFGEVRADFGDDGFGDWFGAFASGGLRRPGDDAGAGESGAADVDETVVEVDVAALEGADLADAQASAETLHAAYGDVAETVEQLSSNLVPVDKPNGFVGFLSEWLGVRILHARSVTKYEEYREQLHQIDTGREILDGAIYPGRLAPAPMAFRFRESRTVSSDRSYSLVNLVMMFFIFCFVGWVWEVSLAFISEGTFVNRGTLHGPWLPIYGTGGVIILILLKKLRKKPLFEFLAAMVLCGGLEYFSSWYLEKTHGGQRWWDYTGYFLNLNGRICAEGLLTFGLGGLAIVYLLAPALDNLLSRIDTRKLTVVAVVLLAFYCVDQAYSAQHPNIGAGITDYKGSATSQVS